MLREAGREELWEESLDGTKYKNMPDRCKRDDQDDNKGDERKDVFESPSAMCTNWLARRRRLAKKAYSMLRMEGNPVRTVWF